MPYFPLKTAKGSAYYCPQCKAWYTRSNVSCCVLHAPGSCCHMGETKLPGKPR